MENALKGRGGEGWGEEENSRGRGRESKKDGREEIEKDEEGEDRKGGGRVNGREKERGTVTDEMRKEERRWNKGKR